MNRTTTPAPRRRAYRGPAILSNGFRPFFLLGAFYAGLAFLIWLPVFHGELSLRSAPAPRDWHIHEMLFGYLPAVMTGFLFTAIPNWTGRLPIQGRPLLTLVLVWIAGRVAVTASAEIGWLAAFLIDTSFLALVAAAATREILAGKNWRNLKVVVLITLLLVGNVAFHIEAHVNGTADVSIRIGIATVVLLISLIGGRIIPSFTRNWLAREKPGRLPAPFGRLDVAIVAITAVILLTWIVRQEGALVGTMLAVAGLLHLVRLGRWAGDRTFGERLVLISARRLCLRAARLSVWRGVRVRFAFPKRGTARLDGRVRGNHDAGGDDARKPRSHRPEIDCVAVDPGHLCRRSCRGVGADLRRDRDGAQRCPSVPRGSRLVSRFPRLLRHVWASTTRSRQAVAQAGARLTSIHIKLWREANSVAACGS